ncbi:hypothetical protein [Psychroserpens sp. Hel_I_66]|uniref:hypothetical protein n=1 Tax=Psychroserpens sp. Hel_I_66 TaxID=1250004 RepID=UPI000645C442|nr:hypothetical protein [Psychroserpens sp. Hel_I_66]
MKILLVAIIFLSSISFCHSQKEQDSIPNKTNPIIYSELYFGLAGGKGIGLVVGGELNYQNKNDLFTVRYGYQTFATFGGTSLGFIGIPSIETTLNNHEIGLLYGQRYVKDGHSFSFSGGISTNYSIGEQRNNEELLKQSQQYLGFPFEINIKWFKKAKKRFRAYYGLIPIGKPTSFGRSFGFKLYGNISKYSYAGIGINYGFGWHKKYE